MIDTAYLSEKDAMQTRFKEAVQRNDDTLALVILQKGERIDPLFSYELVNGLVMITAIDMGEEDGRPSTQYTIGANPKHYGHLDLRPLIDVFNAQDPNVLAQAEKGIPTKDQKRWGGRSAAFGSPFGVNSGLLPEQVAQIVEQNLSKCEKKG